MRRAKGKSDNRTTRQRDNRVKGRKKNGEGRRENAGKRAGCRLWSILAFVSLVSHYGNGSERDAVSKEAKRLSVVG